jgi:hypothetical protein
MRRWRAGEDDQQLWRERHPNDPGRHGTRDLDGPDRRLDEGKHSNSNGAEPAGETMIRVVDRTGMMLVVRARAR